MIAEVEAAFEDSISWLREHYSDYVFQLERDIVWTFQQRLVTHCKQKKLPTRVYNDFPILPGTRRSLSADIALVADEKVLLAVEFKYEPDHSRSDVLKHNLPVVFWGKDGVGKDVERINQIVQAKAALVAHSIFIDEGGAFKHRPPHPNSTWEQWADGVWVLRSSARSE